MEDVEVEVVEVGVVVVVVFVVVGVVAGLFLLGFARLRHLL